MSDWLALLRKPADLGEPGRADAWFGQIADRLLNGTELLVGGEPHRFVEVEFYCFAAEHPDPFTHRDLLQRQCGRWYFHRVRGVYKSGSFKGLDLTFGDGVMFGGILVRGIATPDGAVIDGPSRLVDHLLARTETVSVAELDEASASAAAWESDNPLSLRWLDPSETRAPLRTARVGLALKRVSALAEYSRYLMRPYRFLAEPRQVRKGKPHMVLALHARGIDAETISRLTGCPKATVRRYIEDYEAGKREGDFTAYLGKNLGPKEFCRLAGTWQRVYGS